MNGDAAVGWTCHPNGKLLHSLTPPPWRRCLFAFARKVVRRWKAGVGLREGVESAHAWFVEHLGVLRS